MKTLGKEVAAMSADLLDVGIFSVSEAAALLQVKPQRVRGWAFGYANTKGEPILKNDFGPIDGRYAVSFANLIEMDVIRRFANVGVSVKSMRSMIFEARDLAGSDHPFATDLVLRTDGKKLFAELAQTTGDRGLYDLKDKNWAMYDIVFQSLKSDVVYENGVATHWFPRRAVTPNVVVHPHFAFGEPCLWGHFIPTSTIVEALAAENDNVETVQDWYDLEEAEILEAVHFEQILHLQAA